MATTDPNLNLPPPSLPSVPSAWDRKMQLLSLPTHQHRLRHLKCIAVRNLNLPNSIKITDLTKIQTYFSLHADVNAKAFYKSEVIRGSMNPNFKSFDLSMNQQVNTSSSYFVIRLWAGQNDGFSLIIEWIVDLSGLTYLGEHIHKDDFKYKPNTLMYGMFDGFFGADDEKKITENSPDQKIDILSLNVKVDLSSVKTSYTRNSLSRVLTVLRAIKQTEAGVGRVRHSIEDKLVKSRARSEKLAENELLTLRVEQARRELEERMILLQRDRDKHEQRMAASHQLDIEIQKRFDTLEKDRERLLEKRKFFFECRENYIKANSQLFIRRKQLISELAVIYPIQEGAEHKFMICGVHLPNAEDFQGVDDTRINVGLGSTSHLVLMICHFLDIRSRYQIDHAVSRSRVYDHIIDKVPENNREFPLFGRRKDRFRFNYAVFLLNKTIAQLRDYCGLGTKDLRLTLSNLKSLMELRLGVKFDDPVTANLRRTLLSDRALLQRLSKPERKPSKSPSRPITHAKSSKTDTDDSRENSSERMNSLMTPSPARSRDSSADRNSSEKLYKSITPDYSPKTASNGLSESDDDRDRQLSSSVERHVVNNLHAWLNTPQLGLMSTDDTIDEDTIVQKVNGNLLVETLNSNHQRLQNEVTLDSKEKLIENPVSALSLDDENIDARVQALSSRSSSFKMAQAPTDSVVEASDEVDCAPDPVV